MAERGGSPNSAARGRGHRQHCCRDAVRRSGCASNGFGGKDRREIVTATVASYRQAMRAFAKMTNLDVWYAHADMDQLRAQFDAQMKARQRKMVDKAWPRRGPGTVCRKWAS